jgi:hypothetical protein
MTNDSAGGAQGAAGEDHGETRERMRALVAELIAAGLTAQLYDTRASLDITAILGRPDFGNIAVIISEEGHTQIRYWNDPAATPAQNAAVITRALAVIATASRP